MTPRLFYGTLPPSFRKRTAIAAAMHTCFAYSGSSFYNNYLNREYYGKSWFIAGICCHHLATYSPMATTTITWLVLASRDTATKRSPSVKMGRFSVVKLFFSRIEFDWVKYLLFIPSVLRVWGLYDPSPVPDGTREIPKCSTCAWSSDGRFILCG